MAHVVMVVTNGYDPDPRVQKEAATLVAAGHRVTVYAYDRQCEHAETTFDLEGVQIRRLSFGVRTYGHIVATALGLREFHGEVRRLLLADPPDVLHCHDQDTCALGLWWQSRGARHAGGGRGRWVYDAHDFYWTFLLMAGKDSVARQVGARLLRLRDRYYAGRADLLITVTESRGSHPGTADQYRQWGCDPLVIWNAPRQVADLPAMPARFTVGYLGNVREPDMFDWLIRAIEQLPVEQRPHLRVAGGGTHQAEIRHMLEAASARLGFGVEISGPFAMEEIGQLMAQCSVQFCVYPHTGNTERALPVKMLDSVAHGRPVIGNRDTLMGDWVESEGWGWTVRPHDVAGLAQVLAEAHQGAPGPGSPALPLSAPPTWEQQAERLVGAYARLLAGA